MTRILRKLLGLGTIAAVSYLIVPLPATEAAQPERRLDSLHLSNWTCVPEGRKCTFGSDCCSDNCVSDPKLGKVCKPKDASWT